MSKKTARGKHASYKQKAVDNSTPSTETFKVNDKTPEQIKKTVRDGFANFMSRLGAGGNVDNQISEGHYEFNMLTRDRQQLDAAYRGSWVVGSVIDSIAEDMTKAGIDITSSEAAEDIEELQSGMSRLGIWNSLCDVIKWARLYGGSIGVLMVDGQDMQSPLRIDTVGKGQFTGMAVYDRWQLYPDLTEVIRSGPMIGLPAYYYIITTADIVASGLVKHEGDISKMSGMGIKVHHSRVIRQIGVKLPFWQALTESLWGSSELERIHDRLISFDTATMSAANLINHAHLRTVKVAGLREILSSGGPAEEALIKMFEYMRLIQSNEGITLLDAEDDFATTSYTFSGLSDMMLQFGQQLSGASHIPLVRLFGQSPAGLNSTGESDLRNYYGDINARQESNLRAGVDTIMRLTYKSMFGKPAPSDMQFKFTSLWQMTAVDKAAVGKSNTETICGAFEASLIKRSTALKELRQQSSETGLFTNITDEDIVEAESDDDVPLPSDVQETIPPVDTGKVIDAIFTKAMNKINRKAIA